ncbi:MAG: type II secretion system minor pseudopilin GspK [bacterium]
MKNYLQRSWWEGKKLVSDERGVALMMTLWIMVFLTVIASEFAYSMKTEVNITQNFRDGVQAYYLARAGINRAMVELMVDTKKSPHYLTPDGKLVFGKEETDDGQKEAKKVAPPRKGELEDGTFEYVLTDEESKLNINLMKDDAGYNTHNEKFKYLFKTVCAGLDEMEINIIVDSIGDWIDSGDNDAHKLNGVEEDYYQSLEVPYHCKNGPFDTVEELQLVKGVTREIYSKVAPYITAQKETTTINKNTASETVLIANEMGTSSDEETARTAVEEILKSRAENDGIALVGKGYSSTSSHFTIEGIGRMKFSNVEHKIKILYSKGNIDLWNDNVFDIEELLNNDEPVEQ